MFNKDFYPTPQHVIETMLADQNITGKTILEPSAGKGDIVDYLLNAGASVIACEANDDLSKILGTKCKIIGNDFLEIESHQISHVDLIVMNPPFSADEKHITHAFNIAPAGCKIIALCNAQTIQNDYTRDRRILKGNIETYGTFQNLGDVFSDSERSTGVEIGLVIISKPGGDARTEFEGFFTEEDPAEKQYDGIMPYNFIRDVVNRYVAAVQIYDQQLEAAVKMNSLTSGFYSSKLAMTCTEEGKPTSRAEFKKDLQKSAWTFIFNKMQMDKYTTKGLKEDLNKFIEKQNHIPFSMRNIYKMLETIIGTIDGRMDRALLEVFDRLTEHYDENRYNVEGWKTNSHYLVNPKFIMPYLAGRCYSSGRLEVTDYQNSRAEIINDFQKALCYLTGTNFSTEINLTQRTRHRFILQRNGKPVADPSHTNFYYPVTFDSKEKADAYLINNPDQGYSIIPPIEWGQWFDWSFFEVRAYKKGTMHFKFKSMEVWGLFNQNIARIKGYPLFENIKKAA